MNRTIRVIIAVVFIGVIIFCAISIAQSIAGNVRADITDQKIYTLTNGTKSIISKLNQPVTMKFYYTKTAAMKAPDQILFFNNYYYFVKSLLEEYVRAAKGMIKLEIIDPRPFSDEEADALRFGLRRIPMGQDESFFFGLVLQTQFGVTKNIPIFSPERQNFVEYDISYLIDTAIKRQKKNIGVLSSMPVMGDNVSGYMAQMMLMQGQQPRNPWIIVQQLRQNYEVKKIETDTEKIEGIDILLVIHPKDLPEKTLFAVDQFVLNGGRTIVCIDPSCIMDRPEQQMAMTQQPHQNISNLNLLMKNWGLEMPANRIAADRDLALLANFGPSTRQQKMIGFLGLTKECFNQNNVITANLNGIRMLFAGVLNKVEPPESNDVKIQREPIVSTTGRGNALSINSYELMMPDAQALMNRFIDGTKPVLMGYLVTGRFKSAFPAGVKIVDESDPNKTKNVLGITEAKTDCAVAVFSDVDFITDGVAYADTFFGSAIAVEDNAALLLNTIDDLAGSTDLISIRSRGNFRRPFTVVDQIEAEAEKGTLEEEKRINAEIAGFQRQLNEILSSAKQGQEEVIGSSILQKRQELELKIHEANMRLRDLKNQKRQTMEQLGRTMRNLNTLPGPIIILLIAVILGIVRSTKKRHYISHASDA